MTKPKAFPEKEWFTLEEIALRWGTDRETILHFAESGRLEVCRQCFEVIFEESAVNEIHKSRTIFRIPPELISYFCNFETEWPNEIQCVGIPGERETLYNIHASPPDFVPFAAFGRALDLLVTRWERDRFEAEHRVGAHAGAMPKAPEDMRERKSLLNIIGALLELIKTPRPGRGTDTAVIAELLDNWPEKYGISDRNLKGKFAEARRSLNEDG